MKAGDSIIFTYKNGDECKIKAGLITDIKLTEHVTICYLCDGEIEVFTLDSKKPIKGGRNKLTITNLDGSTIDIDILER